MGLPEAHANNTDVGFRVNCPKHGEGCRRFRAAHMDVEEFGKLASIYYLGTWLFARHTTTAAEHRKFRPTKADVRAYISAHVD